MDIFIIAALSADGFIARESSEVSTSWTSAADKKRFVSLTKQAGAVVMGRRTFETFGGRPLKDRSLFIYSRQDHPHEAPAGVEWTRLPPAELVRHLTERGFGSLAVCGGTEIYSQFLAAGLVKRCYLTVEPVFFGRGISLFNQTLERQLILEHSEMAGQGTLFLDYRLQLSD